MEECVRESMLRVQMCKARTANKVQKEDDSTGGVAKI